VAPASGDGEVLGFIESLAVHARGYGDSL
jgi:hypothetical protein